MCKYELDVTNNNLLGYDNDDDYESDDEVNEVEIDSDNLGVDI